jgi:hypothetical protein
MIITWTGLSLIIINYLIFNIIAFRVASVDHTIGKIKVKKGTLIKPIHSVSGNGYIKPFEFRPDRF